MQLLFAQQSAKQTNTTIANDQLFTIVEQMPKFAGGDEGLAQYLSDSIAYPEYEQKNRIQGKVFASFIVDKKGKVGEIKILKGVTGAKNFDAEVIRVLSSMPAWQPGKHNGTIVRVQMMMPFNFQLSPLADELAKPIEPISGLTDATVLKRKAGNFNGDSITEQIFTTVDSMPQFPGGDEAFLNYIARNFVYPPEERDNGIQGKVFVEFVIDPAGFVRNVKVLKGVPNGPGIDQEAVRVIQDSPQWKPGTLNGIPVYVYYRVPVRCTLNYDDGQTKKVKKKSSISDTIPPLIFAEGEHMPEFPGGDEAFLNFINKHKKYPANELKEYIEGTVHVEFVVRPDGSLTDVKVLKGVPNGPGLDEEAVRVVKSSPKWTPGTQNGIPVSVYYKVPVSFKIKN